jgi:hypothetical protein
MPYSHVNNRMQKSADGKFGSVEMIDVKRVIVMMQRGTETYPMGRRSESTMSTLITIRFAESAVEGTSK